MNVSPNAGLRQVISATRFRKESRTGTTDFRRLSRPDRDRAGNSGKQLPVHGRPGAGGRCARRLRLYQARYKQTKQGESPLLEILFSHELAIAGKHVLLVEGLVHSE